MQQTDILIIGAGAAGLMAAMHLAKAGKKVTVLEARDRTGGRIHTVVDDVFIDGAELGAEFIHGKLPVTLHLLKEAGIGATNAAGDMWRYNDGSFKKAEQFIPDYELLIQKLNALTEDITLDNFLDTHLTEARYAETRDMLRSFASGYDTADAARFSTFAMRRELQSEDEEHQYRVTGGYSVMIAYLEQQIIKAGGVIHLSTIVKQIQWQPGKVIAVDDAGLQYSAQQVVIALPLGVLQAGKHERAALSFVPQIPEREQAILEMGMGAVIKVLLQFNDIFWERQALEKGADASVKNMIYLFSGQAIPTWWTQTPDAIPMLTGWIGGPPAMALKDATDDEVLQLALLSLSEIYSMPVSTLNEKLTGHKIMNWTADDFTRGSYSYATIATGKSRRLLAEPFNNTIYFAGEALYDGAEMGTVEAALASGKAVAGLILSSVKSIVLSPES
ncbi:flavin monoamine oxidase family protein [Mucilaginibacter paludis]|uniref:Tryptophan 2-monooxygenase n=1 Tax=Mucilaginibacter paludis DSM 18603 TaxID=714943 RepID=H1Y3Q2_9SPHI|nr:NAD(P)/FAD-dependent oxidoreductase [Mucilaginibacter paludis]EHQ30314.1 amine oxidase [Mucilaginibacter paludis DSM 18603]